MHLIRRPDIATSEITPRELWLDRRSFIGGAAAGAVALAAGDLLLPTAAQAATAPREKLAGVKKSGWTVP